MSSLNTETSAELSRRSNAYRGPAEGGNSTKATTLDKSTGSEAAGARAKITKAWESTELYKWLTKDDYAEARKVILRNTPLEAIRK